MDDIKVGQLVTWLQNWPFKAPEPLVGIVTGIYTLYGVATIRVDGHTGIYRIPLRLLRRAERVVLAQVAAMPLDDAQREDAVSGCRL